MSAGAQPARGSTPEPGRGAGGTAVAADTGHPDRRDVGSRPGLTPGGVPVPRASTACQYCVPVTTLSGHGRPAEPGSGGGADNGCPALLARTSGGRTVAGLSCDRWQIWPATRCSRWATPRTGVCRAAVLGGMRSGGLQRRQEQPERPAGTSAPSLTAASGLEDDVSLTVAPMGTRKGSRWVGVGKADRS